MLKTLSLLRLSSSTFYVPGTRHVDALLPSPRPRTDLPQIVYEPKVKYHVGDKQPPRISDSLFGWLPPVLHTKEPELVDKIGLDAAIYLRFLRMLRWMFTAIVAICGAVLVPVDIAFNLQKVPSQSRDVLSILTIRDVSGWRLWIHVAVTYVVTLIVLAFVWYHWREVVRLRRDWFRSPEYMRSFYARTLMVTKVPKKMQSDEGIRAIFQTIQVPYPTTSVHIGRKVGQLPELIEYHNNTVRELEAVLVLYLKDGKLAKERPQKRLGGFLCFGGQKVDAINYYMYLIPSLFLNVVTESSLQGEAEADGRGCRALPRPDRPAPSGELRLRVHGCCAVRSHCGEHAARQAPEGHDDHARAEPEGHRLDEPEQVDCGARAQPDHRLGDPHSCVFREHAPAAYHLHFGELGLRTSHPAPNCVLTLTSTSRVVDCLCPFP